MSHLSDGALRRLLDEHENASADERSHLESCEACKARAAAVTADATHTSALLAAPPLGIDTEAALARLRRTATRTVTRPPSAWQQMRAALELRPRRAVLPAGALAVLAALTTTLFATGIAQNMVKVFEPQQVVAVPINRDALAALPDLAAYGSAKTVQQPDLKEATSAGDAAAKTGLHLLAHGPLPAEVHGQATFYLLSEGSASFTFSTTQAESSVLRHGKVLPALPAGLDGSSLFLTAGPAAIETIGGVTSGRGHSTASLLEGIPQLLIVQMKAPVLTSSGLTARQIEDAILSMPDVPSDLAAQVRAIGDPSSTLPIPIPAVLATSRSVDINGTSGVLIGDDTGLGSAVVWVKGGMLYAVAGTVAENVVLSTASSLH